MNEDNENNNKIQPILELKNVKESDAGEYVCAATNDEGSTYSDPLVIDITCEFTFSFIHMSFISNFTDFPFVNMSNFVISNYF